MKRIGRRGWLVLAVVAVLVIGVVVSLTRHSGPDQGAQAPGIEISGGDQSDYGVLIPFGQVNVDLSTADAVSDIGGRLQTAPAGSTYVEVAWQPQNWREAAISGGHVPGAVPVWPTASDAQRQEVPTRLELVSGGRTFVVTDALRPSGGSGRAVYLVPGAAAQVRVQAVAAGRTIPATPGSSADAYRSDARNASTCGAGAPQTGVRLRSECSMRQARAAYVGGLGWAPRGQQWLVITQATGGVEGTTRVGSRLAGQGSDRTNWRYDLAGDPTVALAVSAGTLKHQHGSTVVRQGTVTLADRAYLVPDDEEVTVTLRLTAPLQLSAGQDAPPSSVDSNPAVMRYLSQVSSPAG